MTRKISFEEANKMLYDKHGDNIRLLEFTTMYNYKSKFQCNVCNHIWETEAQSTIIKGRGCKKCASKNLKQQLNIKLEYMIDYINNIKDCLFIRLSEDAHGKYTKMIIRFSCGHEKEISFENFRKSSKICKQCSLQESNKKKIRKTEQIEKVLCENNLELVEFPLGYSDSKSLISYRCQYGHITTKSVAQFFMTRTCKECKSIKMCNVFKGKNGMHWNGGITSIRRYVVNNIRSWRNKSIKDCNSMCVISGGNFDVVHHLYAFNLILYSCFNELNLPILENVGLYSEDDLIRLISLVKEKHNSLLGVCLTKDIHKLFHKFYGQGNNTPQQFEEFKQRIQSGDIQLPD